MQTIDANGSALTPFLLQYAWSYVPVEHRRGAVALLHPLSMVDLERRCKLSLRMLDDGQQIYGVPIKEHSYMRLDQVLIASPSIDGDLFVVIRNISIAFTYVPSAAKCKGCYWTMSITETERGQAYCNRCKALGANA